MRVGAATSAPLPSLPPAFAPSGVLWDQHHLVGPDDDAPVTVRLRGRRDARFDAQVLTGIEPGHLDADGEIRLAATVTVHAVGDDHLDVEVDGRRLRATVVRAAAGAVQVLAPSVGVVTLCDLPRFPARAAEEVTGATRSPMPGVVVAVEVAIGDAVAAGAALVSVEAMKMEHRVTAPQAGVVTEIRVQPGQQVDADAVLVVVEQATE
jgi:biotin carboxyl carrier protein